MQYRLQGSGACWRSTSEEAEKKCTRVGRRILRQTNWKIGSKLKNASNHVASTGMHSEFLRTLFWNHPSHKSSARHPAIVPVQTLSIFTSILPPVKVKPTYFILFLLLVKLFCIESSCFDKSDQKSYIYIILGPFFFDRCISSEAVWS